MDKVTSIKKLVMPIVEFRLPNAESKADNSGAHCAKGIENYLRIESQSS